MIDIAREHILLATFATAVFGCKQPAVSPAPTRPDTLGAQFADAHPTPPQKASGLKSGSGMPAGQSDMWQNDVPQEVLVGTDVEPLQTYLPEARPVLPGRYRAETGGAVLLAEVTPGEPPLLKRQFKEPGLKAATKTYRNLQRADNALVGDKLRILGLPRAILVLEQDSGVEGIPASLWIHFERQ